MGTESSPGVKCGRGLLLTTHSLLVPRSWKSRAIPLPTLWGHTGPVTGSLYLYFSTTVHWAEEYCHWCSIPTGSIVQYYSYKVKQSRYRPGMAQRVPESWGFQITWQRRRMLVRLSALRTGRLYPRKNFSIIVHRIEQYFDICCAPNQLHTSVL